MKSYSFLILVIFFFLFFSSCEDIVDCVINRSPELTTDLLKEAKEGVYYFDKISAGIKNEPNDNRYDYFFNFKGDLPKGLDVIYNYREVILEGVPEETGRFRFTIQLDVDPPYDYNSNGNYNDPLCTDHASESYVLVVK
ncbi:MAG: hypothetical protein ABJL44_16730 [Algibacter sp.]